ncbi:CopD family protein [Roseibium sp.]|uniref:CopD family protein n=1 Tax=Roseibium sp. TaxID=1936156 RepID=UPI003B52E768
MTYQLLKALHLAAAITWIGGLLLVAVLLSAAAVMGPLKDKADLTGYLSTVRSWDRIVTSPAMLIVWAIGLLLAFFGDWFPDGWLLVKLAVVFAVSAVHGVLSGTLRRFSTNTDIKLPTGLRLLPAVTVAAVFIIVLLAVLKPF